MRVPLSFLQELADGLGISLAELGKRLGRSRQNVHELITTGKYIALAETAEIRELAHEAGWTDTVLLDKICRDGRIMKKAKKK
jgi:plasmid maintenance system antidote protein VapI